ncbi:uncharacterized protein Dvir_GJ26728 [Drosophila virilis]|uniref:Transmembrane protein n=1 Tax=Drosophila virilis TaxID=7244 RepID=A0A0Q9WMF3_DROVI|nr:uncharacterized protein Dvir_GJ26728 [Drosophila virilis]
MPTTGAKSRTFTGWWILIDAMAGDSHYQITTGHVYIGIFGTISFCMINTVKGEHMSEDNTSESGASIAKIWLLIGFVIGFASIIAIIWVMVDATRSIGMSEAS